MNAAAARLERLRAQLQAHGATEVGEAAGRVGAVLALLAEREGDLELLLTLRRDDLPTHPGQVSFAGGRREAGETTTAAALREANEEVGLDPASVELIGHLPAFFLPPSRFWLAPVVARWVHPHELRPQETEVAAIVRAPLAHLLDAGRWRKVRLSMTGWSLAWVLDGGHVLWGATAAVTSVLLDLMEPQWRGGVEPADLPDDREVMPWSDPALARRARPALLRDVAPRDRGTATSPASGRPGSDAVAAAGTAIADAVAALRDRPAHVVVLAGGGGNGAAGAVAAQVLRQRGVRVTLVATTAAQAAHAGTQLFDGTVPAGDLYVDALIGGGLHGRLDGEPLRVALALRTREAPVLAVDLPTGVHPRDGLIGDTLPATVTLALGGLWPVLAHPSLAPFVGDLYLWDGASGAIVRLVGGPERATAIGARRQQGSHP